MHPVWVHVISTSTLPLNRKRDLFLSVGSFCEDIGSHFSSGQILEVYITNFNVFSNIVVLDIHVFAAGMKQSIFGRVISP
jgi:hypothetical protein